MQTITAHFDGKVLVPDAPVDLKAGETVELSIRRKVEPKAGAVDVLNRLPLIRISPDDAQAINQDPGFDVEEA
jgi:hypothetical protein